MSWVFWVSMWILGSFVFCVRTTIRILNEIRWHSYTTLGNMDTATVFALPIQNTVRVFLLSHASQMSKAPSCLHWSDIYHYWLNLCISCFEAVMIGLFPLVPFQWLWYWCIEKMMTIIYWFCILILHCKYWADL